MMTLPITDLLRNDGFVIYNKNLAKNIGVNEAILYSELLSRWNYFRERGQLTEDGFFFNTVKDLEDGTALSDYQQRRALNSLKEKGLIEMEVRGMPAKRYFRIVEDSELIASYLMPPEQELEKLEDSSQETKELDLEKLKYRSQETKELDLEKLDPNKNNRIRINNKNKIKEGGQVPPSETKPNPTSLAKQVSLLDKKETKKQKKAREIGKMRNMILAFTTNQEVRKALTDYFNFRVGRGLTLKQWELILSDLREYAGTSASLAIEKIEHALAGGYMTIIASWEKDKKAGRGKNTFDNTAGHEIEDVGLSDEERFAKIEANLVRDKNGNPIVF
jgi:hypothetical protein